MRHAPISCGDSDATPKRRTPTRRPSPSPRTRPNATSSNADCWSSAARQTREHELDGFGRRLRPRDAFDLPTGLEDDRRTAEDAGEGDLGQRPPGAADG